MSFKYCQHVKENGTFCNSGAMKGRHYCYFHLRLRARRLAMAKARATNTAWRLNLPPLEDLHAVQSSIMQVIDAVANGALDPHRGKLILYGLQQAGSNVRSLNSWLSNSRFAVSEFDDMRAIDYPGLEAEFGLPHHVDLDAPPEDVFPPSPAVETTGDEPAPAKKPPTTVKKLTAAEEDAAKIG